MGRHTRAEFAQICGLTPGNLSNYIKRGKVVIDGEFIDDNVFENKEFLAKRREILKSKASPPTAKPEKKLPVLSPDAGAVQLLNEEISEEEDSEDFGVGSGSLTKKKLKVEIAKKIRETEILKLKEQKIKSEIVPTSDISNLFFMHTQSIVTAQKDGIEELLINLSIEVRLTGDQLARLRGKMVEILNRAVDKAIVITEKNMKVMIENFTISREVGEHD